MKTWFLVAVGIILLFAAQRECGADGKFMPPLNVKSPDMPQQRAIIVYRNGVERLIIESAFQGETGEYAWILPVPSEPLEIKKASYPLFKTMFYDFGRKAFERKEGVFWLPALVLWILFALIPLLFLIAFLKGKPSVFTAWTASACFGISAISILFGEWPYLFPLVLSAFFFVYRDKKPTALAALTLTLVFFASTAFIPVFLEARGGGDAGMPGIDIVAAQPIGDYDVTTLKAESADALDSWLAAGGFQTLGTDGRRIAGDYIAEKWCFVTGKLRKADKRLSAPHPIEISFAAAAPVYPMRLTALSGGPLYVDLIIVAEEAYECPLLQTEFTNSFRNWGKDEPSSFTEEKEWQLSSFQRKCLTLATSRPRLRKVIWHTEAPTLLWPGCFISKLSGSLTAADMAADIRPTRGANGKLLVLLTEDAANQAARNIGALLFLSIALLATYVIALKRCFSNALAPKKSFISLARPYAAIVGVSVVVGLAAWIAVSAIVPKAEVRETPKFYSPGEHWDACKAAFIKACSIKGGPAERLLAMYAPEATGWPEMTDQTRDMLRELAVVMEPAIREADLRNLLTGDLITFEESPGNLILESSSYGKEISLSMYDVDPVTHRPRELTSYPPYKRE
ncbi:MAG: DUF2330 domain-containing protein [Candidatus Brocadiia bacterium]